MRKKHGFLQGFALLWSFITLFPLCFTVISSFKNTMQIFGSPFSLPNSLYLDNFVKAINTGGILRSIGNSFFLAICSVILVILIAAAGAYIIARKDNRIYRGLYIYFLSGILIPVHCTFIPLVRMVSKINGTNNYAVLIGIYVTMNLPLAFLLICGYMKGISREMEEAAIIDGCGTFRIFSSIFLPLSVPVLATVGIITFMGVYNDLIFSLLFINDKKLLPISMALNSFKTSYSVDYGPIFAAITLALIPMIIVYALFQEKIMDGMCAGAVKG